MGFLNKNAYEGKEHYAAVKNNENKQMAIANGMTEEQAEAVIWLCARRHWLHTHNGADLANEENSSSDEILSFIQQLDEDFQVLLNLIRELPFKPFSGDVNYYMYWFEDVVDDKEQLINQAKQEGNDDPEQVAYLTYRDRCNAECGQIIESVNNQIEAFLKKVDDKYNTHFCPAGATRMF